MASGGCWWDARAKRAVEGIKGGISKAEKKEFVGWP